MGTLDEFLSSGELGGIGPETSPAQVKELLGEPEDISVSRKPTIWKYGGLQLGFHKEPEQVTPSLSWLAVYFQNPGETLPSRLNLTGWWPNGETTWRQVHEHLERASLPNKENASLKPEESMEFPSGVRVVFREGKVHSIQYAVREQSEEKQLSVRVPAEIWQKIKREATDQRVSPSKLGSAWITEKVQGSS
jgi:hypothetical protein